MSPSYLSPGVYVEEVDRGSKPIESVGTAVAAFIGYTEKAVEEKNGETRSLVGKPTLVTNWSQYVQKFGGFVAGAYLPDSVYGYFNNGGTIAYIVSIKTMGQSDDPDVATPARVTVRTGDDKANLLEFTARAGGPTGNGLKVDVKPELGEDGKGKSFTVVISANGQVAETYEGLTTGAGDKNVETVVKTQSKLVTVKVTGKGEIVPAAGSFALAGGEIKTKAVSLGDYQGSSAQRTGLGGLEPIEDETLVIDPDLYSALRAHPLRLRHPRRAAEPDAAGSQGMAQPGQLRHDPRRPLLPVDRDRRYDWRERAHPHGAAERSYGRHLRPQRFDPWRAQGPGQRNRAWRARPRRDGDQGRA